MKRQDAATLLLLIRPYVFSVTTIVSDQCAAYNTSKNMPEGDQHEAVFCSLYFVDPEIGAGTNIIESLKQSSRRSINYVMGKKGHF